MAYRWFDRENKMKNKENFWFSFVYAMIGLVTFAFLGFSFLGMAFGLLVCAFTMPTRHERDQLDKINWKLDQIAMRDPKLKAIWEKQRIKELEENA